ncbi:MAG: 4Fe-4S binding protein [Syntrophobacteraceae bacterium]
MTGTSEAEDRANGVYERLRKHLDSLPGGYPATESGVELRILKRLFTPEEAQMALFLAMKLETSRDIAKRAGMEEKKAGELLDKMAGRGLIFSVEKSGHPSFYMAAQFIIGIWEYHVNDLDESFVKDVEEYFPILAAESFETLPQLRTIPVGRSIQADIKVLAYEQAEELVKNQKKFLVAPCICRREHQLKGEGCSKLMEACLVFGWGADYYERNGLGRVITLEETLEIIRKADEEGLVLQPSNSQEIVNICCCCGDCCGILRSLKAHPAPASIAATSFRVELNEGECIGCGLCVERCQMEAFSLKDDHALLKPERCIGCGLCVSTCPVEALRLVRKSEEEQPRVPKNQVEAHMLRAKLRAQAKADLTDKLERHKRI